MRLLIAFLKLVRWPNLIFIVLTQVLFYYCIYLPLYNTPQTNLVSWLIVASVCIAAAGYIINDYFDLNIDQINKPDKNVLNSVVSRRWAIVWHLALSLFGIAATIKAVGLGKWYLVIANVICVALLWFYSTSLKRQLLIGKVRQVISHKQNFLPAEATIGKVFIEKKQLVFNVQINFRNSELL